MRALVYIEYMKMIVLKISRIVMNKLRAMLMFAIIS